MECKMIVDGIELTDDERQPCEVWVRVMGYYRPVSAFNIGKKGEFEERVNFTEEKAMTGIQRILTEEAEKLKEPLAKSIAQG